MKDSDGIDRSGVAELIRADVLFNIAQTGWSAMGVMGDSRGPSYNYTIGLRDLKGGMPDLFSVGLPPQITQSFFTSIVDNFKTSERPWSHGEHPLGLVVGDLPMALVQVPSGFLGAHYMKAARMHYQTSEFPVLQLVWSDQRGRLPWDGDMDARMCAVQSVSADLTKIDWSLR